MAKKIITSIISLIILGSLILICNPVDARPKENARDGFDKAKMVEHRIDRLTMILADKEEEGIDIKEAEDILLEAIDLFEAENYDDALAKLDEVEKSLGIERGKFRRPGDERPGNEMFNRDRPPERRHFMKRELTDEEREFLVGEVKEGISAAKRLIDEGKFEEAFKTLSDAQRKLGEVAGIPPPFMQGNRGMMGPHNQGGPYQSQDVRRGNPGMNRGPGFDPETREKLKSAMESLKEAACKYLEQNENDEFIESCFKELKGMEKELRNGEIKPDEAIEIMKSIEEKILDMI
ncbi:hypothetical protein J7L05_11860 [bacterium]|nr:hypothetical protein [bacterium]